MHSPLARLDVLSVCLPDPPDWNGGASWRRAGSAREAIQAMRGRQVELLLSSMRIPDMPLWPLIDRIRTLRPRQPWMLIERQLSAGDEVRARALGVLQVCEQMPPQAALLPILEALRRARPRSESG